MLPGVGAESATRVELAAIKAVRSAAWLLLAWLARGLYERIRPKKPFE